MVRVFISWSTKESHKIAIALKEFLTKVVPGVEPWVSSEDIEPGARWDHVLAAKLEKSSFGIVCLVPENLESPWLHFEAGAIAKSVEGGKLIPIVHGVSLDGIQGPLRQFQALLCDEQGIKRLTKYLKDQIGPKSSDSALEEEFQKALPQFLRNIRLESNDNGKPESLQGVRADLEIQMGFLGRWDEEQIIIENQGDGPAEEIEVFADERPINEASFVVDNQEFVSRLRPGEEFGIKVALAFGVPERADIRVQWREESGEVRNSKKLITLM